MTKKKRDSDAKPQRKTLMGDSLGIMGWVKRIWRTVTRWVGNVLGKRLPTQTAEDNAGIMTMPPPAGGDRAFRLIGMLVLCITLLIMIFGGILGARLYSVLGMGTNRIKNIPIVYMQDRHTLKFKGPLMETPATITEELIFDSPGGYNLDKNTVLSEDGKELFYLNNLANGSGDLYLRNTDRAKPRNKEGSSYGSLVARGVLQGSVHPAKDDKEVLYMRASATEGNTLLLWSNGKEQVLDNNMASLLGMAEDGYLYYTVTREAAADSGDNQAGSYNLCRIGSDSVKQVLDEGLSGQIVKFIPETGVVLYSLPAGRGELGEALFTLACWDGSSVRDVIENVSGLLDFSKHGSVFAVGTTGGKSNPFQYFDDDRLLPDSAMKEPTEEKFMVEKTNLWGGKKTELDKEAYESAVKAYEAKVNRDNIRKAIAAQERNIKRSTLYQSAGSSRTEVDSDIEQIVDTDAAAGVAIYIKERIPTPQKFKVSQISDPYDAIRLLNSVLIGTVKDYYYASVGHEPEMFMSVTKSERVRAELDGGKGIYFIKEDVNGAGAPLNYISVQEAGLGVTKKLDDKVVGLTGLRYRDQMLYLREDSTEGSVTVCAATGQDRSRLVDGLPIYPLPVAYGDLLLCYRDYSDSRQIGSLTMYNGKVKPVARNVHSYSFRLSNFIYVLRDYDAAVGSGDLYLYSGNSEKLTLVDTGITEIKTK